MRAGALVLPAVAVTLVTASLIRYSAEAFSAAASGLKLFLEVVLPSLLPFFVLSELMLGLGVVHFLGVLFEPLMRPLFNVPGEGAFVLSMGLAAGYPMDVVITGKFRRMGVCTRVEGERLLAFTNTADPLFIFGAVAVGMFRLPALGVTLAAAHYLAALTVGLVFRFYGRGDPERRAAPPASPAAGPQPERTPMLRRAYAALSRARREDGRPLGKLLGDAVIDSVRTLAMICGFIIFFSVMVRVLDVTGLLRVLSLPVAGLLHLLGIDPGLAPATLAGLLEIDVGSQQAVQTATSLPEQAMVASAIIAWSGLSVHGQVASVLADTDIRLLPYVAARLLHAVLAAAYTLLLMG